MNCAIEACEKPQLARGMCSAHYGLWRKYGDPTHRVIARRGEALKWLRQQISVDSDECIVWPFKPRTVKGYPVVYFEGRPTGAHRVMCALAYGTAPDGHECAHSCGNRMCVNRRHLRWATPSGNAHDKRGHGTDNAGEKNPQAKLTARDIPIIRDAVASGASHSAVAGLFGISRRNVSQIVTRQTWKHVD